jgi:hypothetical protein
MCRSAAGEARGKSAMRLLILPAAAALLALSACKRETPAPEPSAEPSAASELEAAPPAPAGRDRSVKEVNERYEFEYSYPAAADAIPKLKGQLDSDLADKRARLVAEASEAAKEAKQDGFPYNAQSLSLDWKVVTDLPGWLSLSTIVATFTGGAHPNYVYDTILWDKAAGQRRGAIDLFASKQALSAAIGKDFCAALDREREKKREAPLKPGDMFTDCLDPLSYTAILGSAGHQAFDRIGVLIPPYEAGPYAEGGYEVTLPVTPRILALVKPEYRASFAAGR